MIVESLRRIFFGFVARWRLTAMKTPLCVDYSPPAPKRGFCAIFTAIATVSAFDQTQR